MSKELEHTQYHLDRMVDMILERCMHQMEYRKTDTTTSFDEILDELSGFKKHISRRLRSMEQGQTDGSGLVRILDEIEEARHRFSTQLDSGR